MNLSRELTTLGLLFLNLSINAMTYYLSPVGNDNYSGTIQQPCFSLNKIWNNLSAGDTVYLRGGTYRYTSTQFLTDKSGVADNLINIWSYPGEIPIISKSELFTYKWASGICFTGDYFHWRGIEITGFAQESASIYVGLRVTNANQNIFEQINSHHNGHGCVITGQSGNNLVLNSDFHHNQDPMTTPKYEHADGLEICEIPKGLTNTVKGCRFWWNSDDGLDLWKNDGILEIDGCWSWNNGYVPDTNTPAGNGNGFKLGITTIDYGTKVLRVLRNCVAFKNRSRGFDQNNALCSMELYNNTAYHNGTNGYVFNYEEIFCKVKNCISYKNAFMPGISKTSIVEKNSFSDNNITTQDNLLSDDDFNSLDGSQLTRARKADGSLPDIDFLNLKSGSDLIDAGVDVGLPYYGKAPEIGAFEVVVEDFHLNKLPVVTISFPVKGTSFESPATITVDVNATDPDGSITKVELFNEGIKLGEMTVSPYSFTIKDLPAGSYALKAVATDNMKASSTSSSLDLTVIPLIEVRDYFNLYPNPNDGRFSIAFTTLLEADIFTITVVDLIGKTVYREELSKDESTRQFDLSHLKNGIYILMISANQILLTQKFIKA